MGHVRAWGWYLLGYMHRSHGLWARHRRAFTRAERAFSRALHQRPGWPLPCLHRGILYWRELHKPDRAIHDFTIVINAPRPYDDALFLRAMAYEQIGNYHDAADDLRRYIVEFPCGGWHDHAVRQLKMLRAILDDMPPQLPGHNGLITPGDRPEI